MLVAVLLIVLLAAAGGFLGDLLEFAGWVIVVLVAVGALIGLALYAGYKKVKRRFS